jgi:hypothetical protein
VLGAKSTGDGRGACGAGGAAPSGATRGANFANELIDQKNLRDSASPRFVAVVTVIGRAQRHARNT